MDPSPFSDQSPPHTLHQMLKEVLVSVWGRLATLQFYVPGKNNPIVFQPTHAQSLACSVEKVPKLGLSDQKKKSSESTLEVCDSHSFSTLQDRF